MKRKMENWDGGVLQIMPSVEEGGGTFYGTLQYSLRKFKLAK